MAGDVHVEHTGTTAQTGNFGVRGHGHVGEGGGNFLNASGVFQHHLVSFGRSHVGELLAVGAGENLGGLDQGHVKISL